MKETLKREALSIFNIIKRAYSVVRGHYFLLVFTCLVASAIGAEFSWSFSHMTLREQQVRDVERVVYEVENNDFERARDEIQRQIEERREATKTDVFSRDNGFINDILNDFDHGNIFYKIISALTVIFGSVGLSFRIFIISATVLSLIFWYFVLNTFIVSVRRIFLESHKYKKVATNRFVFPLKTRSLGNIAKVRIVKVVLLALWSLTIVGGIIKNYSYWLVDFILSENPKINHKDAISLSRRMMHGYKMKAFALDLVFLPLEAIGVLTMGVTNVFFINPLKIAARTEFYVDVRRNAKRRKVAGIDYLKDDLLYRRANTDEIKIAYADLYEASSQKTEKLPKTTGIRAIFEDYLGISFRSPSANQKILSREIKERSLAEYREIKNGLSYPDRLSPTPMRTPRTHRLNYFKRYSFLSIVVLFFVFAIIGWFWEVALFMYTTGDFVNRGMNFGPWLPIYGFGGILALALGYRYREKPVVEFFLIFIASGIIEYLTSYISELHYGMRWWDYTGHFMNINGRICLEGLLAFGIGGMTVVYYVAPFIDNIIERMPRKTIFNIATLLVVLLVLDFAASTYFRSEGVMPAQDGVLETTQRRD